jgi:hypothetical protein
MKIRGTSQVLNRLKRVSSQATLQTKSAVVRSTDGIFKDALDAVPVDLGNLKGADVFVIEGIEPKGFMEIEKMPLTQYISNKDQYLPLIEKYDDFQNNLKAIKKAKLIKKFDLNGKTSDGIHPNLEGQKNISNEILKTI